MRRLGQAGVTMVELMVAMILMAIALVALAASIPYAMYGVVASGFQTTATLLAQEALEHAKAADYSSLSSLAFDGFTVVTDCTGTGNLHQVSAFPGFSRCVAVQVGTPTATSTTIIAVVEFSGSVPNPIYRTTIATIRAN
jgi:prepilin-type N-terminal cleavage/methylation domain-containing protein